MFVEVLKKVMFYVIIKKEVIGMFKDELNAALKTKEQLERKRIDNSHKQDIDNCNTIISNIKRIALEKVSKGDFKYNNGKKQVSVLYEYAMGCVRTGVINSRENKPLFEFLGGGSITYYVNRSLVNEIYASAKREGIKILDYGLIYNHEMLGDVRKSGILEITHKNLTFFSKYMPRFYINCVILF